MSQHRNDDLVHAGTVVGIHGLRGDIKVRPLSGDATALDAVPTLHLVRPEHAARTYQVERVARHKGNLLIHLGQVHDATAAQALVGCDVMLERSKLAELPDDEYYWFELEGLLVTDRSRGELGTIADVFSTPAHDIYVVRGRRGEILIPAVDNFIVEIDTAARTMLVDLPTGLLPEEQVDAL